MFPGRYASSQATSPPEIEHSTEFGGTAPAVVAAAAKKPQQSVGLQEHQGEQEKRRWTAEGLDGIWTYEHVVAVPEVGAAFEDFARRALCHESVLFLQEVSR